MRYENAMNNRGAGVEFNGASFSEAFEAVAKALKSIGEEIRQNEEDKTMAEARKCDRCGNIYGMRDDGHGSMRFTEVREEKEVCREKYLETSDNKELCPECIQSLKDWDKMITEPKEEKENILAEA